MGFFDTLFGRQKPAPMGPEKLFAISTAQVALEAEQSLKPTNTAAICFKGMASGPFTQMLTEMEQLLKLASSDDQLTVKPYNDEFDYRWFIFSGADFQALVTALHIASQTLVDKGYSTTLLFAVFPFTSAQGHEMYWMYNYKRGTFYPFVPQTDSHDRARARNNPEELRLATAMKRELPVEPELERWFPAWGLPF